MPTHSNTPNRLRTIIITAVIGLMFCALAVVGCNIAVKASAKDRLYSDIQQIPYRKVGLVLGSPPITASGGENLYFTYRMKAAAELYFANRISCILVSGDNHIEGYNEPEDMRKALIALGVPDDVIYLDYAGFRTYDSMIRAKKVFNLDSVTVISQYWHNERAIFIAQHKGLDAIAYNAKDVSIKRFWLKNHAREALAKVKVVIDLVFHKKPKFLGEEIEIPNDHKEIDEVRRHGMPRYANSVAGHNECDTIWGNFTGKGVDTLYVVTIVDTTKEWDEATTYYAMSNNKNIPKMELFGCSLYQPKLVFEGDLDGDGKDEWGYLHTWMTSQWRYYRVFSLVNGHWRYLIESDRLNTPIFFRSSSKEVVEPGDKPGYVRINYGDYGAHPEILDTMEKATYSKITDM